MDPNTAAMMTSTAKAVLQPGNTTPAAQLTPAKAGTLVTTPLATSAIKIPTATSAAVAPPPSTKGDKAQVADQLPKDGSTMPKNASFDMHLFIKNTGTTTWTTAYKLVFYAGDQMGSPVDFNMPNEVKPGETVKLLFTMTAPDSTGAKQTIWAMQNADGVNFYTVFLKLTVTD
jgi:hypothetical protein